MKLRILLSIFIIISLNGMEPENKIVYRDMPPINRRSANEEGFSASSTQKALAEFLDQKAQQRENPLADSTDTEDSIPTRHHHRRMVVSNGVTALLATCVTAAVTLAVHFSSKCPNPPTGTP